MCLPKYNVIYVANIAGADGWSPQQNNREKFDLMIHTYFGYESSNPILLKSEKSNLEKGIFRKSSTLKLRMHNFL